MKITILAMGSRGDVQPYIALGVGFQKAGHQVRMATHEEFAPFILERGMELFPLKSNPRKLLESDLARDMLASNKNSFRFLRKMAQLTKPLFEQSIVETRLACVGADAIVLSNLSVLSGYEVAESMGIPVCGAYLQPMTPTDATANAFFLEYPSWLPVGRDAYNQLTHYLFLYIMWDNFGRMINSLMESETTPKSFLQAMRIEKSRTNPVYYGYSEHVIPPSTDLPPRFQTTGFWFLDSAVDYQPSPELAAFLDSGPPPVYVGFGSMSSRHPREVTAIVVKALRRSGQRGILNTGWGGLHKRDLPKDIFLIESAPHDWLFPRMAAVVHHGGAGTTAAGLRAGVPTVIVPFFADQPYWGQRVFALGVGPKPISHKHLTAKRLENAIRIAVTDKEMKAKAASLGESIRAEDGVGEMVRRFIASVNEK